MRFTNLTIAAALSVHCALSFPIASFAQEASKPVTNDDLNDANNPLNPAVTLNLHNFYIPDLGGPFARDANALFVRGLVPFLIGDTPNLMRFSIPVITQPTLTHHGN